MLFPEQVASTYQRVRLDELEKRLTPDEIDLLNEIVGAKTWRPSPQYENKIKTKLKAIADSIDEASTVIGELLDN